MLEFVLDRAADHLESVVANALHRAPPQEVPLLAWSVVCGSAVAGRTRPLTFSDGVLHVEVPDVGWQHELAALAPRYLAAMNRYSTMAVKRIEFVVKREQVVGLPK